MMKMVYHKTSSFKTSETSGFQNVLFSKHPAYTMFSLQNIQFQNVQFQNVPTGKYYKTFRLQKIHFIYEKEGSMKYALDLT
jgi:hypothetical protein